MTQRHFQNTAEAIEYIFRSRSALKENRTGLDEHTRDIAPTRNLLLATRLLDSRREYVVVTGSKGKGSVTALTASLLKALGHTVGMVTSPHLRYWEERIRVNGHAIPSSDFCRILSELSPWIDAEQATLPPNKYISPQGIFLLIALRYFDEQNVTCAVLEVGRGGRFDDISLVPNRVSLFTPIFMEHAQYLGDSVARIAWHKAGIIKQGGHVYSLAQSPEVLEVLSREAEAKNSEFFWFSSLDLGDYVRDTEQGMIANIGRYGDCELPFLGRYQIANATLAIQATGNVHARLGGIPHGSPEYVARIHQGLQSSVWYGRLQQLEPRVFLEGAINPLSIEAFIESIQGRSPNPVIAIAGVPSDRDSQGVYERLAPHIDTLILTQSTLNPAIHFPTPEDALAIARAYHPQVVYCASLSEAVALGRNLRGENGTLWLTVAQPLIAEAMTLWDIDTRHLG